MTVAVPPTELLHGVVPSARVPLTESSVEYVPAFELQPAAAGHGTQLHGGSFELQIDGVVTLTNRVTADATPV